MIFPLRTLATVAEFAGRGLHSGTPVTVRIHPHESGIIFRQGETRVNAHPDNVSDTRRCTCVGGVATVEHLMSAFGGLGITGAEVEVDGPELPALDGSALGWVEGLQAVGLVDYGQATLEGPFARVYEKADPVSVAVSTGEGWWRYTYDTGDRWPGIQDFELQLTPERYVTDIAPARTFGLEEEIPMLQAAGLAQGLDLDSALVLTASGYQNPPRFADEPARHKLLDLIGDLSLAGVPVALLNVVAERAGHTANVRAAAKLAAAVRIETA